MIHINDVGCAQWILIEVGVLLQVVAIRANLKKTSHFRAPVRHRDDEGEVYVDEQGLELAHDNEAEVRSGSTRQGAVDEADRNEMNAGQVMRIPKVKFVQTFKFRSDEAKRLLIES